MGMFDTFHVTGDKLKCAAGHSFDGIDLQTKSLECNLDCYILFDGRLYIQKRGNSYKETLTPVVEGELLVRMFRCEADPTIITDAVTVYGSCTECDPVCFESKHSFGDNISHRYPWCEWNLVFVKGKLIEIEPVQLETREIIRKGDMDKYLPDDDRVAKRHIELLRKEK